MVFHSKTSSKHRYLQLVIPFNLVPVLVSCLELYLFDRQFLVFHWSNSVPDTVFSGETQTVFAQPTSESAAAAIRIRVSR